MILSGLTMVIFLIAVAFAAPYGIVHAAIAGGLASLFMLPVYLSRLKHHFGIDPLRWLMDQMPCLTAANAMIVAVWGAELWMKLYLPDAIQLAATILIGAAAFTLVMVILARREILDIVASFSSAGAGEKGNVA